MLRASPLLLLGLLSLGFESPAHAKAAKDLPYSIAESFSAALRFVRIDRGCKVTDKDPEAAFVTWECKEEEKILRGSLEIFRATERATGRETVRVQVTLGDEPHYVELRFLELFERKLRDERGNPPQVAPAPVKKPPPPDLGI